MKLTKTQTKALALIQEKGVLHAYNGISRPTIDVLERAGLVTVERSVYTTYSYRTLRTHYIADWTARPVA